MISLIVLQTDVHSPFDSEYDFFTFIYWCRTFSESYTLSEDISPIKGYSIWDPEGGGMEKN